MKHPPAPDEKANIVQLLRRIADQLHCNAVSRAEFGRRSGVSESKVQRLFGSYNRLVEAAGLVPRKFPRAGTPTYSNEHLITEIVRVLRLPNSKLTRLFFDDNSSLSASTCEDRFGGWRNALQAACAKLDPERDSDLLARIRAHQTQKGRPPKADKPATDATLSLRPTGDNEDLELPPPKRAGTPIHSNIYGDFIHFRGLEHAPVNEQGVVFLFGMICRELGYVVEILKPGFPDCEAKRQIRPGIWQRVRIEFEFLARTFRAHGHDLDQCDVIVCWENNWPGCPIEVLELRSELQRLSQSADLAGASRGA
jgi:hypothetical protein